MKKYSDFYEAYKNKLFRFLVFRCGDSEVSNDIMQESFTRHYQYSINKPALSPSLLFTIARNALVDYQRHENKSTLIQDYAPQHSKDIEADFIAKEKYQTVIAAFKTLPREDQEIMELVVAGLPYKQIGQILELSESNTKVRIHRVRVRLRDILKNGENK
jgi:RNA polymerase sigma-70 factor (ECF subfamily)